MILEKLVTEIVQGQTETIDINTLTVRGIVNETQDESAQGVITTLIPWLVKGVEQSTDNLRKEECLDVFTDIFKRFGLIMLRQPNLFNRD